MPTGRMPTGYYLILTDQAGAEELADHRRELHPRLQQPEDAAAVGEALKFFGWAYKDGGAMAAELDYVPLPAGSGQPGQEATWKAEIKGSPDLTH